MTRSSSSSLRPLRLCVSSSLPSRRGSVGLSVLLVMLLLDLIMVGAVIAGSRDLDLSRQRLDASRAQYAADAALNMALHEVYTNTDDDGDGAIGTLSNDANPADDPTLGPAHFSASRAVGPPVSITATSRCGDAQRSITLRIP